VESRGEVLMSKPIRRVGVIGAGVMGSGIAAHLANAGVEAVLLDIVPPDLTEEQKKDPRARNRLAESGLKNALKAKPAAFFHPSRAQLVRTGNVEDDLGELAGCDLVIEAIIEKMDAKRSLFERLEGTVGEGTIVASNTSGLRIEGMLEGRSAGFKKRFLVTHFFNPARYMKLLELVPGPETDPQVTERIRWFGKEVLGKGIVFGKDTPNFIANRVGAHSILATIHQMLEDGLAPEDVDQITGLPMAHPKSASFRTGDLVGIDTFVHVANNCYESLTQDEDRDVFKVPEYIQHMVDDGLLGNKTKSGFYKKEKSGDILTFDPYKKEYRAKAGDDTVRKTCKEIAKLEDPRERVRKLVADDGPAGKFAWKVLARSLAYSARRVGEIADRVDQIDDGMRWGYNWELGPFETWDALGFRETYARMQQDGIELPEAIRKMYDAGHQAFYSQGRVYDVLKEKYVDLELDPREVKLTVLRKGNAPVLSNDGAEAWDLGDGVLGVTYKTKANSLDGDVISLLGQAADEAERNHRALLLFNQGEHFSVGANLFMIAMAANEKQWDQIRSTVSNFQSATQRLKYARVPVVAAPYGMAVGGGLEVCLCSDAIQAAAETYSGLVEPGVGLLPGGAGNLNMLWRALEGIPEGAEVHPLKFIEPVFKNIAMAKVATSADEAKQFGFFRRSDGVSFDRARHLHEAKQRAIGLAESGYHPPVPRAYKLAGESGMATLEMMIRTLVQSGWASEHDGVIARQIARVLCGGAGGASHEVTEDEMLELEREAFVSLCGEPKSQERMQHMLQYNKPLRN
jgi:3-hydroxyacyl-CoA dehydrogenase